MKTLNTPEPNLKNTKADKEILEYFFKHFVKPTKIPVSRFCKTYLKSL